MEFPVLRALPFLRRFEIGRNRVEDVARDSGERYAREGRALEIEPGCIDFPKRIRNAAKAIGG